MDLHHQRLKRLLTSLPKTECDALIIDDHINLFYLTGLHLSAGKLLVHSKGAHLLVDSRYIEMCKKLSPFPVSLSEGNQTLFHLLDEIKAPLSIAFDRDRMTYGAYLELDKDRERHQTKRNRTLSLKGIENPIAKLRMIKDFSEIKILREAAKLGSEGFDHVCSMLKEGITEAEIAVELEIFWKNRGGASIAFAPIIAFGANSSMPHYCAGKEKLRKGNPILVDIGVKFSNYHSDMSRVVYFGKPDPVMLAIHEVVERAQNAALALCNPKTRLGQLDSAARKVIDEAGFGDKFTHSLGHGVGLEIHEFPIISNKMSYVDQPLQEGMVVTIEPGIYLPGIGGVRIEDTIVITKDGYEDLTSRPKKPIFYH